MENSAKAKLGMMAVLLICVDIGSRAYGASEGTPSRQDSDLVMAAVQIGMTEEQRYQFRDIITTFVGDYRSAMLQIARGHNATDLERRMEKRHKSLFRRLDHEVQGMLSEAQLRRYVDYRRRLEERLSPSTATDPGEFLDWEFPPATHH